MVKPVRLANSRAWPTQKDALQYFKGMLWRHTNGERVTNPTDHDDLCALLIRYDAAVAPGQATKGGGGIAYFSRERNVGEGWATDGFHVHRIDGSSDDFSYIGAVKG